jgi:hypothetical protein
MRKKYIITAACLLGLLTTVLFVAKRQSRAQSLRTQIPEHVMYRHLFHHVLALKKKAEELEKNGKDASQFRTHFKRQAELSDEQVRVLELAAVQYDRQEKVLDSRAKPIIDAYKAQYPGGQVPHGQTPVAPPVELRNLSQERDALALRGRDQLRAAFGYDFERFDKFIKTRVAADTNIQSPR